MANTSLTRTLQDVEAVPAAVTPPDHSTETSFLKKPKLATSKSRKREIPEGLWTKCPKCSTMHSLVETCSFEEMDAGMTAVDVLKFTGVATYASKLEAYKKSTGLKDAVITGLGTIGTQRVALGVMDFSFLGGSMGSVVGEKLTRMIEAGTARGLPVIIISTSGGARMYEGMFSLMQMAKTSAALAYHARNKLPYISVLTHPTTAGVMASYASLGDLIIAEPGAMIGFAGPRVIKDTTQAELPPGFQTAEFLLDRGLIDAIVPRLELKGSLCGYLECLMAGHRREQAA